MGAEVELTSDLRAELLLFHEGPSRVLISASDPERVAEIAARHGVEALLIGETIHGSLDIRNRGTALIHASVNRLRAIFEGALENKLRA